MFSFLPGAEQHKVACFCEFFLTCPKRIDWTWVPNGEPPLIDVQSLWDNVCYCVQETPSENPWNFFWLFFGSASFGRDARLLSPGRGKTVRRKPFDSSELASTPSFFLFFLNHMRLKRNKTTTSAVWQMYLRAVWQIGEAQ